uniref:MIP08128p n=1 Tax=Drosophila melanogaster TaxID=7227 RepID=C4JC99_DROME|nr:MIP08128p [Drosophila melanogaster]
MSSKKVIANNGIKTVRKVAALLFGKQLNSCFLFTKHSNSKHFAKTRADLKTKSKDLATICYD